MHCCTPNALLHPQCTAALPMHCCTPTLCDLPCVPLTLAPSVFHSSSVSNPCSCCVSCPGTCHLLRQCILLSRFLPLTAHILPSYAAFTHTVLVPLHLLSGWCWCQALYKTLNDKRPAHVGVSELPPDSAFHLQPRSIMLHSPIVAPALSAATINSQQSSI